MIGKKVFKKSHLGTPNEFNRVVCVLGVLDLESIDFTMDTYYLSISKHMNNTSYPILALYITLGTTGSSFIAHIKNNNIGLMFREEYNHIKQVIADTNERKESGLMTQG